VLHPALAKALQVLEQRSLSTVELVLTDLLDGSHQVAQRAHERERPGVQRLDLAQNALEQRSQLGAIGLAQIELLDESCERVAVRKAAARCRVVRSPRRGRRAG